MIATAIVSAIAVIQPSLDAQTYEVVSSERTTHYAGKLGQRVAETLTLKFGDRTLTVHLGRYHTRLAPVPDEIRSGDRIRFVGGDPKDGGLVLRCQIRKD